MMKLATVFLLTLGALAGLITPHAADWQPAQGPLMTRWAKDVSPQNALPEYPRPQLKRADWLNLNGLWDYAIADKDASRPAAWDGRILVPYPLESALSGVMKRLGENQRLWYRRTFQVPDAWIGKQVLLHFGAVDWEATVWVNRQEVGRHRGGYDAFKFDMTTALKPGAEQEIVVAVWDPTDAGYQPRGKQIRNPHGIWYTPTSGIWQTVWIEPVAATHLDAVRITPDVDAGAVRLDFKLVGGTGDVSVKAEVQDGTQTVASGAIGEKNRAAAGSFSAILELGSGRIPLWTPDTPFLYGLKLTVSHNGTTTDQSRGPTLECARARWSGRHTARFDSVSTTSRCSSSARSIRDSGPMDCTPRRPDEALRSDIR